MFMFVQVQVTLIVDSELGTFWDFSWSLGLEEGENEGYIIIQTLEMKKLG